MKNDKHITINKNIVEKVSILAQLSLTEEEKNLAGEDMTRMLDFFALLSSWEEESDGSIEAVKAEKTEKRGTTENSEPVEMKETAGNILRLDEVQNKEDDGLLMENAPLQKDGMFVVPLSISAGSEEEASDGQD